MPRSIFRDPFRGGDNVIVMADCYKPPSVGEDPDVPLTPIPTNTRHACMKAMEKVKAEEPWFGIEQVQIPSCSRTVSADLVNLQVLICTETYAPVAW